MASPIDLTVLIPIRATEPQQVEWLHEAVESVEMNGYPARLHILDDGSPLDIGDAGSDVAVIDRFEEPAGVCAARNYLGWNCESEYLMFLDADDRLVKGAIEKMAGQAAPDRVVFPDLRFFGNGHTEKWHAFPQWEPKGLIRGAIMPMTSIHTKAAFEKVNGFDATFETALEDWDYNIRLMLAGFCGHRIAEPLLEYRQHSQQRTSKPRSVICGMRQLLREKYTKIMEEKTMPCCGGGGARGRSMPVGMRGNPRAPAKQLPRDEMVLVEYTGGRAGAFTETGKYSGQPYRFSTSPIHFQKYVLAGDAEHLILKPDFHIIEHDGEGESIEPIDYQPAQPIPKIVRNQGPQAVMEMRTVTETEGQARLDDLTAIKGISARRAEALGQIGVQTFEALAVMRPDELSRAISRISEKTAKRWIEEARALV